MTILCALQHRTYGVTPSYAKKKKLNLLIMRISLLVSVKGNVSMSLLTSFSLKMLSCYVDPSCKPVTNAPVTRTLASH